MKINVMDTWAVMVEDDTLRQNSKKTYNVEFNFDKCWDGYSKTVIFEAGPASVIVALTEDRCTIPAECLKHGSVKLQIGIYGVNGDERKGTIWCLASMEPTSSSVAVSQALSLISLKTSASVLPSKPAAARSPIAAMISE